MPQDNKLKALQGMDYHIQILRRIFKTMDSEQRELFHDSWTNDQVLGEVTVRVQGSGDSVKLMDNMFQ